VWIKDPADAGFLFALLSNMRVGKRNLPSHRREANINRLVFLVKTGGETVLNQRWKDPVAEATPFLNKLHH